MLTSPFMRCLPTALLGILLLIVIPLIAGCGEQAGSGQPVNLPTFTLNCTTVHCRTYTSMTLFVYITPSNCNPTNLGNSVTASKSLTPACTSGGCTAIVSGSWTGNDANPTTQIPSSTYTVCGRLVWDSSSWPNGSGANDTVIELDNVTFTSTTGAIPLTGDGTGGLGTWQDP